MNAKNPGTDGFRSEIALRAYFIWEREGRPEGRQHEHWARAEAEIMSEQRTPKKVTAKKVAPTKNPADKKATNGAAKPAKAGPDAPVKAATKTVKKKAAKPKKSASPDA